MEATQQHILREAWLTKLVGIMGETLFKPHGYEVPEKLRISVGWPRGKRTVIGQHWQPSCSADGSHEIFISPRLADAVEVAATVAHEVGHAILPAGTGHRKPFAKLVDVIGLIGKPTHTQAGPPFMAWFRDKAEDELGPYPHAMLSELAGKKQTTRLLRIHCPECEDAGEPYILRASKAVADRGLPICPIHENPMALG